MHLQMTTCARRFEYALKSGRAHTPHSHFYRSSTRTLVQQANKQNHNLLLRRSV